MNFDWLLHPVTISDRHVPVVQRGPHASGAFQELALYKFFVLDFSHSRLLLCCYPI